MSAFEPRDVAVVGLVLAVLLGTLAAGFGVTWLRSPTYGRGDAWLLTISATVAVERLCADEPPGLRMLAIIAALWIGMKTVVSVEHQAAGGAPLPLLRWLGFAGLSFAMRPSVFAKRSCGPLTDSGRLLGRGLQWIGLGLSVLLLAHLVGASRRELPSDFGALIPATLLALAGICMVVHFGIVTVTAGVWRWFGFDCRPIMRTPLAARSLGEFWGRRWNIAFAEMMGLAVARPLTPLLEKNGAVFAAFLCSGVLHELAISVPVRAGFGLPLLYFALHGSLVLTERGLEKIGRPIDRAGWLAHVWTIGWLLVPLPILFHPYFIQGVVWPLIGIEMY
jgi:alginate O-acetyltransferase complex protein AlgI